MRHSHQIKPMTAEMAAASSISFAEGLVGFSVVEEVAQAVHGVFQQGCGEEDNGSEFRVDRGEVDGAARPVSFATQVRTLIVVFIALKFANCQGDQAGKDHGQDDDYAFLQPALLFQGFHAGFEIGDGLDMVSVLVDHGRAPIEVSQHGVAHGLGVLLDLGDGIFQGF